MTLSGFRKAGHTPTLVAAFLYFDVSFMVWVLLGPLGPFLGDALKLSATQKGFLIALPLLAGSFFRPLLGLLADRIGGRKTGLIGLSLTLAPLLVGWKFASTLTHFHIMGIMLGIAGASFAVALPLASRWYPAEYQGLAMGIAGAGNSGTLLAPLFAPRIAMALGWHNAFGIAMIPVAIVMALFAILAKDCPRQPAPAGWSQYAEVLRERDTGWFCLLYAMTFGSFVGLASFLTSSLTTSTACRKWPRAISLLSPFWLGVSASRGRHDRGQDWRLQASFGPATGVGVCLAGVGTLPSAAVALGLLVLAMGMLGMGNGAVFQMVPQRFASRVGILTGIVAPPEASVDFCCPRSWDLLRIVPASTAFGFYLCACTIFAGAVLLLHLGHSWLATWNAHSASRVGLFSYRAFSKTQSDSADLAA
jgi:Nitrate/nitrite transporter